MAVRAKFRLDRVEQQLINTGAKNEDGSWQKTEMRTLILTPVYGNGDPSHENTKFWKASPSGEIRLGTVNEQAWKQFELGAEYYIDFTKAE